MNALKICAVACLAVVAAACGADGGDGVIGGGGDDPVSADAEPYVKSLSQNLSNGNESLLEVDNEQADCIAPKWVETLKPDRLKKARIKPADLGTDDSDLLLSLKLSEAEGRDLVNAFGDCGVDVKATFLASDSTLTDDDKACLSAALSEDVVKEVLVTGFTKGPYALGEAGGPGKDLAAALAKCPGATDGG